MSGSVSYGSMESGVGVKSNRRSILPYIIAGGAAVLLGSVAVADLLSKGAAATALAWVPVGGGVQLVPGQMLYDAALEPLYTEGPSDEVIQPYSWINKHGMAYDPIAQNAFNDLPMNRADIKDPDMEFRGMAPHSMEYSCDKTHSCEPEINVLDYLPESEGKTLANAAPHQSEENAWDNMPFDY